jgi:hypothetical protein
VLAAGSPTVLASVQAMVEPFRLQLPVAPSPMTDEPAAPGVK